jgi:hypothetical protein
MRRLIVSALAVAALLIPAASANAQVQRHVHNLETPNGETHSIAGGVTFHAPCTAFLDFHNNVHLAVFASGKNPHPLSPDFIAGEFC